MERTASNARVRSVFVAAQILLFFSTPAHAIDYRAPTHGAEPLGRGGAFTAKADTPLAMEYNVAGLAQQRRITGSLDLDVALVHCPIFHSETVGDRTGLTWATQACFAPRAALILPFASRWTIGLGYRAATMLTPLHRSLATFARQSPDTHLIRFVEPGVDLHIPSIAVGVRVHPFIDVGLGVGLAVADFVRICRDTLIGDCGSIERSRNPANPVIHFGVLLRTAPGWSMGISIETAPNLGLQRIIDTAESGGLPAGGQPIDPLPSDIVWHRVTDLPWLLRVGVRHEREVKGDASLDVECDLVAGVWAKYGPWPEAPALMPQQGDSIGLRIGVAVPMRRGRVVVTPRGGFYFDYSDPGPPRPWPWVDGPPRQRTVGGTAGLSVDSAHASVHRAYAALMNDADDTYEGEFMTNLAQLPGYLEWTHTLALGVAVR